MQVAAVKKTLLTTRMQQIILKDGNRVAAPWQFRNCAMGGRHTEKEYPESNICMQESMFMPLSPKTYEDAQEMTVKLQYRLKEIIESAPGAKVMGVGLEGGIAPYVDKAQGDQVPEQRMWRFMKQAILDCEWVPGVDVAIALDPACSELENAYREERGEPDSVGMYRFWRDKGKVEMSRDQILNLFKKAMEEGIPILSIEDGFGERDHQGWKNLMKELGDKIFIIGDDLVTTKDSNIEKCAKNGEINASLIKANQIGTLTETVLAMLTSLAYGAELVISHRSKSPNDPFEAEIGTAMNALGVKCGGGANTERLQKYGRMMEILALARATQRETDRQGAQGDRRERQRAGQDPHRQRRRHDLAEGRRYRPHQPPDEDAGHRGGQRHRRGDQRRYPVGGRHAVPRPQRHHPLQGLDASGHLRRRGRSHPLRGQHHRAVATP